MSVEIRPSRRDDREQLTGLVNAHVRAVVPAIALSVNTVMSQLEREPGEPIVDPCVRQRLTLVAIEHDAVGAGALRLPPGPRPRWAPGPGPRAKPAGWSANRPRPTPDPPPRPHRGSRRLDRGPPIRRWVPARPLHPWGAVVA